MRLWISKKAPGLIESVDFGSSVFSGLVGIVLTFAGALLGYGSVRASPDMGNMALVLAPVWAVCLVCGLWILLIKTKIRIIALNKTSGKAIIANAGLLKRERTEIPLKEVEMMLVETDPPSQDKLQWSRILLVTPKENVTIGESGLPSEAKNIAKEMANFLKIPVEKRFLN